jgi:hypothetical protein
VKNNTIYVVAGKKILIKWNKLFFH